MSLYYARLAQRLERGDAALRRPPSQRKWRGQSATLTLQVSTKRSSGSSSVQTASPPGMPQIVPGARSVP